MQSGWDCGVDLSDPRINVDERLAAMCQSTDWLRYILDLPMATESANADQPAERLLAVDFSSLPFLISSAKDH